ncbi:MAG TPA: hypothetical protein VN723_00205 [Rhizomicrobium sp.]|jgi:hypothetical protein|nr:hypothetical protein [Rhizomicrobium sp.]
MKPAIQPGSLGREIAAAWANEDGVCIPDFLADAARDPSHDADHILPRLGLSVAVHWKQLPRQVQKVIFDDLGAEITPTEARDLKQKVARFLHDKSRDPRPFCQVRPWPLGTMTF